jgi:hypothetical protein
MLNPDDIVQSTLKEAKRVLDEMQKTKDPAQRKEQSEILKNLCQSAGVFFDFMTDTMMANGHPEMDDLSLFVDND